MPATTRLRSLLLKKLQYMENSRPVGGCACLYTAYMAPSPSCAGPGPQDERGRRARPRPGAPCPLPGRARAPAHLAVGAGSRGNRSAAHKARAAPEAERGGSGRPRLRSAAGAVAAGGATATPGGRGWRGGLAALLPGSACRAPKSRARSKSSAPNLGNRRRVGSGAVDAGLRAGEAGLGAPSPARAGVRGGSRPQEEAPFPLQAGVGEAPCRVLAGAGRERTLPARAASVKDPTSPGSAQFPGELA